jgi:hypothetical protein
MNVGGRDAMPAADSERLKSSPWLNHMLLPNISADAPHGRATLGVPLLKPDIGLTNRVF